MEGLGLKLSVVVASHDRPLRLRWLLNALEEQTLDPGRWEVVVAHDSDGPQTEALLREHPLAARRRPAPPDVRARPGPRGQAQRGLARRAGAARRCSPTTTAGRPPDWLANALAAASSDTRARSSRARRAPDPDELAVKHHAPHARSQEVDAADAVGPDLQHRLPARAARARSAASTRRCRWPPARTPTWRSARRRSGAPLVAAPEVLTYHAVEAVTLPARLRETWRWQHLALLVRAPPAAARAHAAARSSGSRSHALAAARRWRGLALARRHPRLRALLVAAVGARRAPVVRLGPARPRARGHRAARRAWRSTSSRPRRWRAARCATGRRCCERRDPATRSSGRRCAAARSASRTSWRRPARAGTTARIVAGHRGRHAATRSRTGWR